jgi:Ca2+-binding EF-hand superfamily protein
MRNWLLAIACVAFVSHGATADAQKEKPPKKTVFEKLDADGNGQISLDEYCVDGKGKPLEGKQKDNKEKTFKTYDTDSSGSLSAEEFKLRGKKPKPPKNS